MRIFMTRKRAFRLAWKIFWMATGTSLVGIEIHENEDIELMGAGFYEEV